MEANRFLGDVAQCVVKRFDAELGERAVLGDTQVRVDLPGVGQVRVVDLEQETSVGDRLVLFVHGVGDRVQEVLVSVVVSVLHPVLYRAWSDGQQEYLEASESFETGLEVVDIALHGGVTDVLKRSGAHVLGPAQVASAFEILWEFQCVATVYPREHFAGDVGSLIVPAEPLSSVARKVGLAELTVVDAIETHGNLLLNDLGDRASQPSGKRGLVVGLTATFSDHHLSQVGRSRQAAGVGREYPFVAPLHALLSSISLRWF